MNEAEQAGIIAAAISNSLIELNVCVPCTVTKVNGHLINAEIAINRNRVQKDGSREFEKTMEVHDVRIVYPSTKRGWMRVPLSKGDKGLLIFADYDVDNWHEDDPDPHTARTHDLNDGFFYPAFAKSDESYDHKCTELGYKDNWMKVCDDVIKTNVDIVIDGIPFSTHVHGGVKRGNKLTFGPL